MKHRSHFICFDGSAHVFVFSPALHTFSTKTQINLKKVGFVYVYSDMWRGSGTRGSLNHGLSSPTTSGLIFSFRLDFSWILV